jgi:hypothetical protein
MHQEIVGAELVPVALSLGVGGEAVRRLQRAEALRDLLVVLHAVELLRLAETVAC